jgi:hypothetical protein
MLGCLMCRLRGWQLLPLFWLGVLGTSRSLGCVEEALLQPTLHPGVQL